ncbi:MAG: threonine aldolase family protein [Saprospiraceae bacterium]
MQINLISDTVTIPCDGMLEAMFKAQVGDDVFNEDPTINKLQELSAEMFGMEAGLFCPSGTMTNQIALACHTERLDEVICHEHSHIFTSEVGGYAYNSNIAINLLQGEKGKITAPQVQAAVKPKYDWLANSKLVVLENSTNIGGGSYYELSEMEAIRGVCDKNGMKLHLDGARVFNALIESGNTPKEMGQVFHSISICLSKGLGAPVGSVLLGTKKLIAKARRLRKAMGGGMRQAGYLAAAGIFALENNVERLKEDNDRAKVLGNVLSECDYIENIRAIETNIIIFDVKESTTAKIFLDYLKKHDILAVAFGPQTLRFVTHKHITDEMIQKVSEALRNFK